MTKEDGGPSKQKPDRRFWKILRKNLDSVLDKWNAERASIKAEIPMSMFRGYQAQFWWANANDPHESALQWIGLGKTEKEALQRLDAQFMATIKRARKTMLLARKEGK